MRIKNNLLFFACLVMLFLLFTVSAIFIVFQENSPSVGWIVGAFTLPAILLFTLIISVAKK